MAESYPRTTEIVGLLTGIFEQVKLQVESKTQKPLEDEALQVVLAYQDLILAQQLKYPPDPPADLKANTLNSGEIELTWVDNTNNPDRYEIERCLDESCSDVSASSEVSAQERSFVDRNLPANTVFRYRVRATNVLGKSAFSQIAHASSTTDSSPYKTPRKGS